MSQDTGTEIGNSGYSNAESPKPFKGEVINYPNTGKIVVVIGYHSSERDWGRIIQRQFEKYVTDKGRKVVFLEIKNSPVETGEESPVSNNQIAQFINSMGEVEMVIDIHEHPEAQADSVRNQWSLTTEDNEVIHNSQEKIPGLRTLPFDDYSRRRTAGRNLSYAITDPDLPSGGINNYIKGIVTPQMQQAINSNLRFIVELSNIQLGFSSTKKS